MYDFTQCLSDAIENVTHSICTLEFEDHRPLYDWIIENIDLDCRPKQIEFARLDLSFTITSKRKLLALVSEKKVNGWDDPSQSEVTKVFSGTHTKLHTNIHDGNLPSEKKMY